MQLIGAQVLGPFAAADSCTLAGSKGEHLGAQSNGLTKGCKCQPLIVSFLYDHYMMTGCCGINMIFPETSRLEAGTQCDGMKISGVQEVIKPLELWPQEENHALIRDVGETF